MTFSGLDLESSMLMISTLHFALMVTMVLLTWTTRPGLSKWSTPGNECSIPIKIKLGVQNHLWKSSRAKLKSGQIICPLNWLDFQIPAGRKKLALLYNLTIFRYDQAPDDCEPGYCNFDSYRRFIALKETHPNFHPMISIGAYVTFTPYPTS